MQYQKLLLVDDDPDLRLIGRISLGRIGGWEVLEASSGSEALEQARLERPDLILLDVMMPGMDGVTALLELRKEPLTADIPVIFMTAKAQRSEVDRYRELGAVGVIPKPFDPMLLSAHVHEIMRSA
jgi:two-component system OmpR family response regulator